jgi:hypothetical protein
MGNRARRIFPNRFARANICLSPAGCPPGDLKCLIIIIRASTPCSTYSSFSPAPPYVLGAYLIARLMCRLNPRLGTICCMNLS